MQRIPAEIVTNQVMVERRNELAQEVHEVLEQGAAVFDLARSIRPRAVWRRNVVSRVGDGLIERQNAEGRLELVCTPIPEQPEEYELPSVVTAATKLQHKDTHQEVSRRAAVRMSLWYDYEKQSGVERGLPLPSPVPDAIRLQVSRVALADDRYEEPHKIQPLETISGDYVQVYADDDLWQPTSAPFSQYFPAKQKNEAEDWGAFMSYPREALTQEMVDFHVWAIQYFAGQLAVLQAAILNPELNPRPTH